LFDILRKAVRQIHADELNANADLVGEIDFQGFDAHVLGSRGHGSLSISQHAGTEYMENVTVLALGFSSCGKIVFDPMITVEKE
jgi:hypothetical protein